MKKDLISISLVLLCCFSQTVFAATSTGNAQPSIKSISLYNTEVKNNSDGTKDEYIKTRDGKLVKEKTYNEKGTLIQELDYTQKIKSIYSYKTGKLYQRYVADDSELQWFDINTGNFIAKTVPQGNGICKTYGKNKQLFTGSVQGHMFGADYTLKYKNGDIDVYSVFDALVKMSIIDKDGEFIAEPFYYFKFLKRILIVDSELNTLDSKAIIGLQKIIDTK